SAGGAIYNLVTLTLSGVTVQNNVAQGFDGAAGGGGIWSSGTLTVADSMIRSNQALGGASYYFGDTENGMYGWSGYGGGLHVAGGPVTLRNTTITGNTAKGGTTDVTGSAAPYGKSPYHYVHHEPGVGGGLYIAPAAQAYLDAFTVNHVTQNHADIDPNIS